MHKGSVEDSKLLDESSIDAVTDFESLRKAPRTLMLSEMYVIAVLGRPVIGSQAKPRGSFAACINGCLKGPHVLVNGALPEYWR